MVDSKVAGIRADIRGNARGFVQATRQATSELRRHRQEIGRARVAYGQARGSQARFINSLNDLRGPLAAAGGLFGAGALVRGAANYGTTLNELARIMGITTTELQQLGIASQLVGVEWAAAQYALRRLLFAIGEARNETGEYLKVFERLGIELQELDNLSSLQTLQLFADRLDNIANHAERVAAVRRLLGETGDVLTPLLSGGEQAFTARLGVAARVQVTTPEENIALEQLDEALVTLGQTFKALGNTIVAEAAPALVEVFNIIERVFAKINEIGRLTIDDLLGPQQTTAGRIREQIEALNLRARGQEERVIGTRFGVLREETDDPLQVEIDELRDEISDLVDELRTLPRNLIPRAPTFDLEPSASRIADFGPQLAGDRLRDQSAESLAEAMRELERSIAKYEALRRPDDDAQVTEILNAGIRDLIDEFIASLRVVTEPPQVDTQFGELTRAIADLQARINLLDQLRQSADPRDTVALDRIINLLEQNFRQRFELDAPIPQRRDEPGAVDFAQFGIMLTSTTGDILDRMQQQAEEAERDWERRAAEFLARAAEERARRDALEQRGTPAPSFNLDIDALQNVFATGGTEGITRRLDRLIDQNRAGFQGMATAFLRLADSIRTPDLEGPQLTGDADTIFDIFPRLRDIPRLFGDDEPTAESALELIQAINALIEQIRVLEAQQRERSASFDRERQNLERQFAIAARTTSAVPPGDPIPREREIPPPLPPDETASRQAYNAFLQRTARVDAELAQLASSLRIGPIRAIEETVRAENFLADSRAGSIRELETLRYVFQRNEVALAEIARIEDELVAARAAGDPVAVQLLQRQAEIVNTRVNETEVTNREQAAIDGLVRARQREAAAANVSLGQSIFGVGTGTRNLEEELRQLQHLDEQRRVSGFELEKLNFLYDVTNNIERERTRLIAERSVALAAGNNDEVIAINNLLQQLNAYASLNPLTERNVELLRQIAELRGPTANAFEAFLDGTIRINEGVTTLSGKFFDLEQGIKSLLQSLADQAVAGLFPNPVDLSGSRGAGGILGFFGGALGGLGEGLGGLFGSGSTYNPALARFPGGDVAPMSLTFNVSGSDTAAVNAGIRRALPSIEAAAAGRVTRDMSRPSALRTRARNI